ncbi:hypothetical protein NDU88_002193 [Pleurodeles waltl]|uniref:Uncharacterized protein n=1 Tax=Pleurodeles waltl TaxID=8319 RepID=A0AAV7Q5A9_PLEWA|nr:hypothetical protein NDU88_002193 [Pleurodeles waltl]
MKRCGALTGAPLSLYRWWYELPHVTAPEHSDLTTKHQPRDNIASDSENKQLQSSEKESFQAPLQSLILTLWRRSPGDDWVVLGANLPVLP